MGDKYHLTLNTHQRPIANKYREGKMQRTLKRELKGLETFIREANLYYVSFIYIQLYLAYLFNIKSISIYTFILNIISQV